MDQVALHNRIEALGAEIADDEEFAAKAAALYERFDVSILTLSGEAMEAHKQEYHRFISTPQGARLRRLVLLPPTDRRKKLFVAAREAVAAGWR